MEHHTILEIKKKKIRISNKLGFARFYGLKNSEGRWAKVFI